MADQWTIPQTDPRGHHVIPPDAEHPGPAFQPNMPTYQEGEYPTVQNCNCTQCFAMRPTQVGPTTWYPVEQQDRRHFGSIGSPHLNHGQNVANRAETALIVPNRTPAQLVPPQTAGIPDFGYASVYDRAGPSNVELLRAPILDASIAEARRHLAGRYLNNPDAYISMIRLEPGTSGQFQVVITLEMVNVL